MWKPKLILKATAPLHYKKLSDKKLIAKELGEHHV